MQFNEYKPKLCDKVVLVTGAASGFGKLLAEHLVELESRVILVDINPAIEDISALLNQKQQTAATHWILSDLCQTNSIRSLFNKAIDCFGHIDVVVNNAGIANECSLFSQADHDELERIVRLNLMAPMETTRIAVRYFKTTKRPGVIINTASVGGLLPISIMESYGTTKAGLIFFTTTCKGLAPHVRVNAIAPYFAETPLVANNRMVKSFPLVRQMGLMNPKKVVSVMLQAICDEDLSGDTLLVAMGAKPEKLSFYDKLTVDITSYIARGTLRKYASFIDKLFFKTLNSTLGFIRKKLPYKEE
ncbi:hypothetical protein IWW42_000593 [Coemansia sp. RSA 1085]|nr:hypothetical protein BX667DRAFT_496375 [Coemansia mojavensis]KAJ2676305.1 hypothetical protein IWW42_000593 [Coemansia sp. RSA 1085]